MHHERCHTGELVADLTIDARKTVAVDERKCTGLFVGRGHRVFQDESVDLVADFGGDARGKIVWHSRRSWYIAARVADTFGRDGPLCGLRRAI